MLIYHLCILFGEMSVHVFNPFSNRIVWFLLLSFELLVFYRYKVSFGYLVCK